MLARLDDVRAGAKGAEQLVGASRSQAADTSSREGAAGGTHAPTAPRPLGPLGSSSSHDRRTPELILQKGHASFRITSSPPVQRIAAETGSRGSPQGACFSDPRTENSRVERPNGSNGSNAAPEPGASSALQASLSPRSTPLPRSQSPDTSSREAGGVRAPSRAGSVLSPGGGRAAISQATGKICGGAGGGAGGGGAGAGAGVCLPGGVKLWLLRPEEVEEPSTSDEDT
ncbi:hypothetical protein T484DRAFT_3304412 [Baffinella frigidus]|nr:hypothetical protein T484DRAFT_3304412 [Cryptophyta sp. CCMP2293]